MADAAPNHRSPEDPIIYAVLALVSVGLLAVLVWMFWAINHAGHDEEAALRTPIPVVQAA